MIDNYNPFSDVFLRLYGAFLKRISKRNDIDLVYEMDITQSFKKKVQSYFGEGSKFSYYQVRKDDASFPLLSTLYSQLELNGSKYTSNGVDATSFLRFTKTSGEFLERMSTFLPLDEWKKNAFNKEEFFASYKNKTIRGISLLNTSNINLPAEDVYWGLPYNSVRKVYTTSGGAGHFSSQEAIVNAWLELIQRDSFMVHWLNTISPQHIVVDEISKDPSFKPLKKILDRCRRYNISIYLLDITSDIAVPTCCCVAVVNSGEGMKIGVGAGAGFDALSVMLSSINEALNILNYYFDQSPFYFEPGKKVGRNERLSQSYTDQTFKNISFLFNSQERITVEKWISTPISSLTKAPNAKDILKYLITFFKQRLKINKDYNVFKVEIENSLLKSFNYKVIRIVCYGLYQLYLDESHRDLSHPRLQEFLNNKNITQKAQLNSWPHPFP